MYENMQRVGSRLSNDGQPAADVSPSSGKTQVEEPVGHQIEQGNGKLNRPHKPFSLKNLGSMTHLPAAAGGVKHAGQWMMGHRSNPSSPALSEFNEKGGDYFADKMSRTSTEKISRSSTMMTEDERKRKEWEQEKKKRKKAKEKKKEQEIFVSDGVQLDHGTRRSSLIAIPDHSTCRSHPGSATVHPQAGSSLYDVWFSISSTRSSTAGNGSCSRDQLPSCILPWYLSCLIWRRSHSHVRDQVLKTIYGIGPWEAACNAPALLGRCARQNLRRRRLAPDRSVDDWQANILILAEFVHRRDVQCLHLLHVSQPRLRKRRVCQLIGHPSTCS